MWCLFQLFIKWRQSFLGGGDAVNDSTITLVIMQKRRERRALKERDDRDLGRGGLAVMLRPRVAKQIWIPARVQL